MDCSLPASSVHEIVQARIPEWIVIFSSRGSSQPRDQTCISCISCISFMAGRVFTINASGKLTPALGVCYFNTLKLSLGPSLIKEMMSGRREREKMDELMKGRKMNGRRESEGKEGGCINRCEEENRSEWSRRRTDGRKEMMERGSKERWMKESREWRKEGQKDHRRRDEWEEGKEWGRKEGWMCGWMDKGWIEERKGKWMDVQISGWKKGRIEGRRKDKRKEWWERRRERR